jgi:hypothetical protein
MYHIAMFSHFMGADAAPAGGAALGQVAGMTLAVTLLTAALLRLGLRHRAGRSTLLTRLAARLERATGLPGWAALPGALAGLSLLAAVFGLYWDVSLHIDQGRDPGPLANPAHYFILLGLYGIFTAGWFALVLPTWKDTMIGRVATGRDDPAPLAGRGRPPRRQDPPAATSRPAFVRITASWEAPVGGVLMMACASFALLGFPLDDVSHRLFGQDVTLWGPTHLMMLGGAALTLVAILVLLAQARLARPHAAPPTARPPLVALLHRTRVLAACGGMLVGLSIFQGEFDFGVPQFRLLFHPLLIAFAASLALVLGRTLVGRGGALATALFFIVLRGLLTLLVGPVLGETTAHFPLYLVEALLVEGLAFAMRPGSWRFGAAAAALIGTVGVLAEWGWSHVWMPLPWPAHLLPAAIGFALAAALAGATLGTFMASALRGHAAVVARPRAWAAAGASVLALGIVVALLLPTSAPTHATAAITLRAVHGGPDRTLAATIHFAPADVVRDPEWLTVTAWQGHGQLVVDRLRPLGGGAYATTQPIPVFGSWKAMVRLQRGRTLAAIPLALPADPAIPVKAVPARLGTTTRAFEADEHVLQRERRRDVPTWLWGVAGLVVLGCTLTLLLILGWGLVRLARATAGLERPGAVPPAVAPRLRAPTPVG